MASRHQNLSVYNDDEVPNGEDLRICVIISDWNAAITKSLLQACVVTLYKHKVKPINIIEIHVPGSYELPQAAQLVLESQELDAVICLGCIIKGETKHDDYIAGAVANGIMMVSLDYSTPVVFGVLTTENLEQAEERSGGKHGNKGDEAAVTALKMAGLRKKLI